MDTNNSWWVSTLLAADCGRAWLHPEWEGTVMYEMKKKDEEKRIEVEHQKVG